MNGWPGEREGEKATTRAPQKAENSFLFVQILAISLKLISPNTNGNRFDVKLKLSSLQRWPGRISNGNLPTITQRCRMMRFVFGPHLRWLWCKLIPQNAIHVRTFSRYETRVYHHRKHSPAISPLISLSSHWEFVNWLADFSANFGLNLSVSFH